MNGGTLQQIRNLINRCNISSNSADKNVNAAEDFFHLVGQARIIAACIKYFGMVYEDGVPQCCGLSTETLFLPKEERRAAVYTSVLGFVQEYFCLDFSKAKSKQIQTDADENEENEIQNEEEEEEEDDEDEDGMESWENGTGEEDEELEVMEDDNESDQSRDLVNTYACELMSYYLLYCEYEDAVREGDGTACLDVGNFYFASSLSVVGKNYTIEAFLLLMQYHHILSPRQAEQLLWSRFINIHGRHGKNVECDLRMEHLNKECKSALGANITDKAIIWAGRSIGTTAQVLDNFDAITSIKCDSGAHSWRGVEKDLTKVLNEIHTRSDVFNDVPGRHHTRFKRYKSTLSLLNTDELCVWMKNHLHRFT